MAPSAAEVTVGHARHVASAKAADVASAKATDVASAKAAHVTSAKAAAHVASAATTTVPSATAAAGLRISGNKAAGKQCTCQDHRHSSSHDIFLLGWAEVSAAGHCQTVARAQEGKCQRRDGLKMVTPICDLY
jgi:hypothetical protein